MRKITFMVRNDKKSLLIKKKIILLLKKKKFIIDNKKPNLIVCIGGDGTIHKAFHKWFKILKKILFVSIHTGTLGFYSDYSKNDIKLFLKDIEKKPIIEKKKILKIVYKKKKNIFRHYAINEIRIENVIKVQKIKIFISGEFLESFRGNGICVSGQHGSTAYNKTLGGSILYPGLDLLQITEISSLSQKKFKSLKSSIILPSNKIIKIKIKKLNHTFLCFDHLYKKINNISEFEISNSKKYIYFAHFNNKKYINRLKKLF